MSDMNPKNTVIVSDLDGVLVDTYTQLQRYIWDKYTVWVSISDIDEYKVYNSVHKRLVAEMPPQYVPAVEALRMEIDKCCWESPDFYRQARPYEKYWSSLRSWPGILYFVTARPNFLEPVTVEWLVRHGFVAAPGSRPRTKRYEKLILSRTKHETVLDIMHQHPDFKLAVIDDRPKTIQKISQLRRQNLKPYLVDYPWSREETNKNPGDYTLLRLKAIAELIKEGSAK